ncbi:MAG: COP23 domain-containing protein [Hormoscilla sp.]
MTAKPGHFTARMLATAVTMSGIVACTPQQTTVTPLSSEPTTFKCKPYQNTWGTFAQRGNAVSQGPMIVWNTIEFGNDYTPEKRCDIVSQRFTDAVASNGGMLSNLDITTGTHNKYPVVCFVIQTGSSTSGSSPCNDRNLLFTLKNENADTVQKRREVLARLTNFSQGKTGSSPVYEREEFPDSIPLEVLVNKILPQGSGW